MATSAEQRRVLSDIAACRTEALGGHVFECDQCGHRKVAYNPCGNRQGPPCQAASRAQWLDKRLLDLLPVVYFHVVFTLPQQLGPLALQNPRIVYGILFRAVAETLLELGQRRLAARFGFLAVLHTWGQTLGHHAHLHGSAKYFSATSGPPKGGWGWTIQGFRFVEASKRRKLRAPSALARLPQNKLSEHSRRPTRAQLRSLKNIQIPITLQHRD